MVSLRIGHFTRCLVVGFLGKNTRIIKTPGKLVLFVWMDALSLGKILKI